MEHAADILRKPGSYRMKVLISTFSFPPEKNGVAEASAACAEVFQRKGWSVTVATSCLASPRSSLDWRGVDGHEFAISGTPHFRHFYQGSLQAYRDFLISRRWDVIFFEGYSWPLDLAVPLLDRLFAKKVLVSHGYGALAWTPVAKFPFGLGALAFSLGRSLGMLRWVKKIDRWVFLSRRTDFRSFYDHWLAQKIRHPGIRVIPNGLDPARRGLGSRFRFALGIPNDTLVFLCVGYFSRGKNQVMALQAYRKACVPNSCLIFIAPKPNEWMTVFKHADPGPDPATQNTRVFWLTDLSRQQTLDAFAGCDIYVSSSYLETQPISILEAMRESKPWIALKAGCLEEIPGGFCVSTIQKMAEAMWKMSVNQQERTRLGVEGSIAVQRHFSLQEYNQSYCQMVEQLVGTKT